MADPGEGPALLIDQTEARRAEKQVSSRPPPAPFSQGLDDRGTPLSEGLDPPLHVVYARLVSL